MFFTAPALLGVDALGTPALLSILLLLFLNTFIAPTVIILYMYRFGKISSLHIDNLSERRQPYLVAIVTYAVAIYLFGWQLQPIANLAPQIALLLASVTVSLVVVALVSLFWKISAHATGMGGFIGMIGSLQTSYDEPALFIALILSIILTGWLLSARLQLNAHNSLQILAGFLNGLVIAVVTAYLFF